MKPQEEGKGGGVFPPLPKGWKVAAFVELEVRRDRKEAGMGVGGPAGGVHRRTEVHTASWEAGV